MIKQWYACRLKEKLLRFEAGEIVYIRRVKLKVPLAGGPYFVLFRMKKPFTCKFFESMGVKNVVTMWPNNVNPKPAPEDKNTAIDIAYQALKKKAPDAERHDPATAKRVAELMSRLGASPL